MSLSSALAGFVAAQHIAFLVLESVLFKTPIGLKVFKLTPAAAETCSVLAFNQGIYNGFLAAGLVWGLLAAPDQALGIKTFFLACVIVAGVAGGATVGPRLLLIQGLPALLALVLLRAGR